MIRFMLVPPFLYLKPFALLLNDLFQFICRLHRIKLHNHMSAGNLLLILRENLYRQIAACNKRLLS